RNPHADPRPTPARPARHRHRRPRRRRYFPAAAGNGPLGRRRDRDPWLCPPRRPDRNPPARLPPEPAPQRGRPHRRLSGFAIKNPATRRLTPLGSPTRRLTPLGSPTTCWFALPP